MNNQIQILLAVLAIITLAMQSNFPQVALEWLGDQLDKRPEDEPAWMKLLLFKKGSSSAPAADPNIGKAAMLEAQTGVDYLNFAKEQFAVANKRQEEQDKLSNEVTSNQLAASKQAQGWATEDRERYTSVFQPLQDDFIDKANSWDSKERQSQLAAEAKADVLNNASQQRQQTQRSMASMGVNPTSGRYAGVDRAAELSTGLAAAGAENNARNTVRNQAVAMKADAVNMGNGLAVNPASSLGLGVSAGSAAMGTTSGNNAQSAGNSSIMGAGFQAAMQGYGQQASILQNQYNSQLNAWQAQQANSAANSQGLMGGIGSIGGMAMVAF